MTKVTEHLAKYRQTPFERLKNRPFKKLEGQRSRRTVFSLRAIRADQCPVSHAIFSSAARSFQWIDLVRSIHSLSLLDVGSVPIVVLSAFHPKNITNQHCHLGQRNPWPPWHHERSQKLLGRKLEVENVDILQLTARTAKRRCPPDGWFFFASDLSR